MRRGVCFPVPGAGTQFDTAFLRADSVCGVRGAPTTKFLWESRDSCHRPPVPPPAPVTLRLRPHPPHPPRDSQAKHSGHFLAQWLGEGCSASGLNGNHSRLGAQRGTPPPLPSPPLRSGSAFRSSVARSEQEQGPESAFTRKIMPAPAARKIDVNRTKWDRPDPPPLVSTGVSARYTRPSLSL